MQQPMFTQMQSAFHCSEGFPEWFEHQWCDSQVREWIKRFLERLRSYHANELAFDAAVEAATVRTEGMSWLDQLLFWLSPRWRSTLTFGENESKIASLINQVIVADIRSVFTGRVLSAIGVDCCDVLHGEAHVALIFQAKDGQQQIVSWKR